LLKKHQPDIGRNVKIGRNVEMEADVVIGDDCVIERNATLYAGTRLGAGVHVGPGCILGERPRAYYQKLAGFKPKPCVIGANSVLRAGTIIYGDVQIGAHFESGPYVSIREKTKIGHHSRFGNYSDIQGFCSIGNYVAGHSNVTVGQQSRVADFVWLHPYVILLNDWFPPTGLDIRGPVIGRYSVIGAASVIFPGVKLGEHVIVGAQSAVKKSVKSHRIVSGQPAVEGTDARKLVTLIKGKAVRPYPWMRHRKAGYPWEKKQFK